VSDVPPSPAPPPLDFLVIGAPKCGTTWFEALLDRHPDICFGTNKDGGALAVDILDPARLADAATYHSWFDRCRGAARTGESAVYYLYSEAARAALMTLEPLPRIFILVRNPVDQVVSYHGQLRAVGAQPEADLGRAWRASPREAGILDYRRIGDVATAITPWQESFGDRVQVILFDDLVRDPEGVLRSACEHLGLDPGSAGPLPPTDSTTRNARSRPRFYRMARWLRRPPGWISALGRTLLSAEARAGLARRLNRWNDQPDGPARTDPALLAEIRTELAPCVDELERITGRDLSAWRG